MMIKKIFLYIGAVVVGAFVGTMLPLPADATRTLPLYLKAVLGMAGGLFIVVGMLLPDKVSLRKMGKTRSVEPDNDDEFDNIGI